MNPDPKTVLLTTANEQLTGQLLRRQRALDVRVIDGHVAGLPIGGQYWCFIDWLLPDISGLEMCRRLRQLPATRSAHITMLLPLADEEARCRAIHAGADDYMVGALDADRLLRRLYFDLAKPKAVMLSEKILLGDLQVDKAAYIARYQGRRIALALNEFRLLIHFVEHPNRVFNRSSLIAILHKSGERIDERTVDVWIGRLRRAFKAQGVPDPLRTVRSVGYVLDHVESELTELPDESPALSN
jgi:two-component system, OmpR family, phosphate regulon response regulator PhoB